MSRLLGESLYIKLQYYRNHKEWMSLKHPLTLNQLLVARKIEDKNVILGFYVDKVLVRDYVRRRISEKVLIPLLFYTNDLNELKAFSCNHECVLKPSHLSGDVILLDGFSVKDFYKYKKRVSKWLSLNYYDFSREVPYKDLVPKVLIEQRIYDDEGLHPNDYKFHCIKGNVVFIQVDTGRFSDHKRAFYSKKWEKLNFTWSRWRKGKVLWNNDIDLSCPNNLREMIMVAETLADRFDYIRVDLYNTGQKIYFGELTFFPGGGLERFCPNEYDYYYHDLLMK